MSGLESMLLWSGAVCYGGAWLTSFRRRAPRNAASDPALWLTAIGVLVYANLITLRWLRTGYGPFVTLFEVQISNLFTLGLIAVAVAVRLPDARAALRVTLLIFTLLAVWATQVTPASSHLPPSFDNPWLWVHVGFGKVFLGLAALATGWSGVLLCRRVCPCPVDGRLESRLDLRVWQFIGAAFLFHSAMIVAGAVWANEAWGRYWAWDPLETWAFITWLTTAAALHLRLAWELPKVLGWCLVLAIFGLAFLTFFGVPFLSLAPHKGIV